MTELAIKQEFTNDQITLIKSTIAKGATNDEFMLFMHQVKRLGLDPFAKQVHFVKYGSNPGTVIVGVDGFRIVAARTGKHDGTERGVHRNDKGEIVAGWAKVYRKDWTHPAFETVPFKEYFKAGKPGYPSNWEKMPETMIKKVAEVAALRMAFPDVLSGVYAQEEMDQADSSHHYTPTAQSGPTHIIRSKAPTEEPHTTSEIPVEYGRIGHPTVKQIGRMMAIAKEHGWNETTLRDLVKSKFNIDSLKDLLSSQYEELCDILLPQGPGVNPYPKHEEHPQFEEDVK